MARLESLDPRIEELWNVSFGLTTEKGRSCRFNVAQESNPLIHLFFFPWCSLKTLFAIWMYELPTWWTDPPVSSHLFCDFGWLASRRGIFWWDALVGFGLLRSQVEGARDGRRLPAATLFFMGRPGCQSLDSFTPGTALQCFQSAGDPFASNRAAGMWRSASVVDFVLRLYNLYYIYIILLPGWLGILIYSHPYWESLATNRKMRPLRQMTHSSMTSEVHVAWCLPGLKCWKTLCFLISQYFMTLQWFNMNVF